MNSGSQTKSQVKNTECRSKPSQLLLIHRKTGYVAPNLACSTWAVSCVLQWDIYYSCDEHRRSFSIPRINSFKGILNSPIILFIHLTTQRPFLPLQAPHSPAVVPLRAPAKGSPNTEGCCSSSLMGQHGQTMLWTCLWEQGRCPAPAREALAWALLLLTAASIAGLVPTQALTLELWSLPSTTAHTPHLLSHAMCNTCQGCILGSHACHLIRSPFNSILSFIWWNASRGPNHLHVTNTIYFPYFDCFWQE